MGQALEDFCRRSKSVAGSSDNSVGEVAVGHVHRDFWSTICQWGRLYGSFRARYESGAGSSGLLFYERRMGPALLDFWWTK